GAWLGHAIDGTFLADRGKFRAESRQAALSAWRAPLARSGPGTARHDVWRPLWHAFPRTVVFGWPANSDRAVSALRGFGYLMTAATQEKIQHDMTTSTTRVQTFSLNTAGRDFAVGDILGCFSALLPGSACRALARPALG